MAQTFNRYIIPTLEALRTIIGIVLLIALVATLILGFYTLTFGDVFGYLPVGETMNRVLFGVGMFDVFILCGIALIIL